LLAHPVSEAGRTVDRLCDRVCEFVVLNELDGDRGLLIQIVRPRRSP
jgi:hypothetical protein